MLFIKGKVTDTNGFLFIIYGEDGSYTVVEGELNLGDIVSGNFNTSGDTILTNHTAGEKIEVHIQGEDCTKEFAYRLLRQG